MTKRTKIYLVLFVVIIGLILYAESVKPKPINWFPTYTAKHKLPYGTHVLRNELQDLVGVPKISDVKIAPYTFLRDTTRKGTYIFIDGNVNIGKDEFKKLLQFIHRGNDVFLSTHGGMIDTLNMETKKAHTVAFEQKPFFKVYNTRLTNKEFEFDRPLYNTYFTKIDTAKTVILGKTGYFNSDEERVLEGANFIKYKHGKGTLFVHTFPEAFTNYFVLNDKNRVYTEAILSYLDPKKPILWDTYYKTGKSKITSPMHYLLTTKSLKWAYYMVLVGVLLFVIFEGKRKQRFIRVIEPLKNQTLAFTRTISNMYYEKSEHKNIAEHKITYLLDYIRTKLHVPTVTINDTFYEYVSSRSGNTKDDVIDLFKCVDAIHNQNTITKEQLLELNEKIEKFKNPI